jgi:hypothetical protein
VRCGGFGRFARFAKLAITFLNAWLLGAFGLIFLVVLLLLLLLLLLFCSCCAAAAPPLTTLSRRFISCMAFFFLLYLPGMALGMYIYDGSLFCCFLLLLRFSLLFSAPFFFARSEGGWLSCGECAAHLYFWGIFEWNGIHWFGVNAAGQSSAFDIISHSYIFLW